MTIEFFNLGEKNQSVLVNFLQDALAKNNEFEIRFGKFYQNKQTNKTAFESNVDIPFFYSLKKVFDASFEQTIKETKETVYTNVGQQGNIKIIRDLSDNSETILLKNTIKKYDIYDYDFRYSVAYEKTQNISLQGINLDNYETIRYKHRITYNLPFGHLDLTIVNQEMPNKTLIQKHEVELEITKNDINIIIDYLTLISQIRQSNFYITPKMERRSIINEYKSCTNTLYFIGAQPESLCKDKIPNLYKYEYSVTDKADGDRAFLLVNQVGDVYFIDNNLDKIFKTDIKCDQNQNKGMSILDGELVRVDNCMYFLAFDILYMNNTDLRGNNEYLLKRRLEVLQTLLKSFNKSQFYSIISKDYYFGNVFSASKKILDSVNEKPYKNDGLIFTPVNEPYPKTKKWSSLLKWKPAELNTIDFFAVKIASDNNIGKWQLYVQGDNNNTSSSTEEVNRRQTTTKTVLFDIEKLCGTNQQNVVTYQTTFPDTLIDKSTNAYYISNTVIEFVWNSDDKKFVPLRTRWDKTNNPKKHGNYSKVACNIWNNIHNPIDKEFLCQFYSKQNDKSDVYFEKMRRFHNKIKEQLYNKYCKNTKWLLELCSGKGGDMHKWTFNNIENVHGYDISDRNIIECKRRFNSLSKDQSLLNYNFYNLDLTKNNSYDVIYKNNPDNFDVICCQFGFHYFFGCGDHHDNIMKILDTSLKTDGYFIITFLDNTCIDDLFKESSNNTCSYELNGEVVYFLERDCVDNTKIYGNSLKITLNGNNILGEGSNEWIINYNSLLQSMEVAGFECVETQLFQDVYDKSFDLSDCEKNISFLNRYCVFKKRKIDIIKLPAQNIIKTKHSKFDFTTIDLHQNNFSIYKINLAFFFCNITVQKVLRYFLKNR
jgi:SAM-dependent methyltransferase